MVKIIYLDVLL